MKQGTTQSFKITLECDISNIDSIIFTIKSKDDIDAPIILQKYHPQDTEIIDGVIYLGLTQEETLLFKDYIYLEGQVNFRDKSVGKTQTIRKLITDTLYTQILGGNKPVCVQVDEITLSVGEVVVVRGADGKDGAQGIQGERGEKGEKGDRGEQGLQGPQGERGLTGEKGIDGKDYTLSAQDKQEIANIVQETSASKDDLKLVSTDLQSQIDTINTELVGVSALQQANLDIIGGTV